MKRKNFSHFLAIGLCGAVLAGCSTTGDNTADTSTTELEETQSVDTTSSESSSAASEASSSSNSEATDDSEEANASSTDQESQESIDVSSELKMNSDTVLLPSEFPGIDNMHVLANIQTNETDHYEVIYTDDQENKLATVSRRAYSNSEEASEKSGLHETTEVSEEDIDLGYGIMGDEEGGAGHFLLNWTEGRWRFNIDMPNSDPDDPAKIASDSVNVGKPKKAAKEVVEFLESNTLPIPRDKGTVSMNYGAGEKAVSVTVKWQDQNMVYEVSSSQTPVDTLTMVISMNQ